MKKRWEYLTETLTLTGDFHSRIHSICAQHGWVGWELVATHVVGDRIIMIFKQEVEE